MKSRSLDAFDRGPTPEEARSIINEVGEGGFVEIKFFDTRVPVLHEGHGFGIVDEGGIEITTSGQEGFLRDGKKSNG